MFAALLSQPPNIVHVTSYMYCHGYEYCLILSFSSFECLFFLVENALSLLFKESFQYLTYECLINNLCIVWDLKYANA